MIVTEEEKQCLFRATNSDKMKKTSKIYLMIGNVIVSTLLSIAFFN